MGRPFPAHPSCAMEKGSLAQAEIAGHISQSFAVEIGVKAYKLGTRITRMVRIFADLVFDFSGRHQGMQPKLEMYGSKARQAVVL